MYLVSSPTPGLMVDDPPEAAKHPLCVLIVEDEGLIRMMVAETLMDEGFRAAETGTAKEALEVLNANGEELCAIILDVGLPDANGQVLLEKIRALRPVLPIIMTTGYDTNELRQKASADPHLRILTKPFQLEMLGVVLREMGVGA